MPEPTTNGTGKELDNVEAALARWGSSSPEGYTDAQLIRDYIRTLSGDDPLFSLLKDTNNRLVASMDSVAKDVPKAIAKVGEDLRTEVRSSNRQTIWVVVICLCLMAGLVGTSIVLTRGGISVNTEAPHTSHRAPE